MNIIERRVGDSWVVVKQARLLDGLNSYDDREWFVYDRKPEDGGNLLAQGRIANPPNNVDPDRAAGTEAIEWMLANGKGPLDTGYTW